MTGVHPTQDQRDAARLHCCQLLAEGQDVVDHLANERRLLAALTRAEQETLAALLRRLLLPLEDERVD